MTKDLYTHCSDNDPGVAWLPPNTGYYFNVDLEEIESAARYEHGPGSKTLERPSWDETWLEMTKIIAKRSTCDKRQVGAVIVDRNQRLISVGYNGAPAQGWDDWSCKDMCPRYKSSDTYLGCPTVHAETNSLLFVNRSQCEGSTIYVTTSPCYDCAKLISNSGVVRVVWSKNEDTYRNPEDVILFLLRSNIEIKVI